jgi:hypothetical protein
VVPAVPGFQFQLENYASKIRALSLVWFLYAAFSLFTGMAGLTFAHAFLTNHFGNWNHNAWSDNAGPPVWFFPMILRFAWTKLLVSTGLAIMAGLGLRERAQWGRIVAIIVAFLSLLHFPFGTVLGIWTLVLLMGYQNSTLYAQLSWNPQVGPQP